MVCIGISTAPSKTQPSFFPSSTKLANCPSPLFLGNSPPLYWYFVNPPLKVRFFSEPPKCESSSSLIPSYLSKVIKFLGKTSQFQFLVMTDTASCLLLIKDNNDDLFPQLFFEDLSGKHFYNVAYKLHFFHTDLSTLPTLIFPQHFRHYGFI